MIDTEPGSSSTPVGVLVMAYGTADGPDDIERYYTDIRGGRAPSPEHLQELRERYEAIGNVFPLLDTTAAQAEGLVERLNVDGDGRSYRAYLGMKHSPPFIPDGVDRMRDDGITDAIGIVMAPHWSGMSVETYIERVHQAVEDQAVEDQGRRRRSRSCVATTTIRRSPPSSPNGSGRASSRSRRRSAMTRWSSSAPIRCRCEPSMTARNGASTATATTAAATATGCRRRRIWWRQRSDSATA